MREYDEKKYYLAVAIGMAYKKGVCQKLCLHADGIWHFDTPSFLASFLDDFLQFGNVLGHLLFCDFVVAEVAREVLIVGAHVD